MEDCTATSNMCPCISCLFLSFNLNNIASILSLSWTQITIISSPFFSYLDNATCTFRMVLWPISINDNLKQISTCRVSPSFKVQSCGKHTRKQKLCSKGGERGVKEWVSTVLNYGCHYRTSIKKAIIHTLHVHMTHISLCSVWKMYTTCVKFFFWMLKIC